MIRQSKLQATTTLSKSEAEYQASGAARREAIWFVRKAGHGVYVGYRCVSISRTPLRPDFDESDEFSGTGTVLLVLNTLTRIRELPDLGSELIRTFIGL